MKKGTATIQTANDAAAASQLAGFTVLAPSYLPDGYTVNTQPGPWTVVDDAKASISMASISYDNQAADGHFSITEQKYQQGVHNKVMDSPEKQDVTVRGQPGAWLSFGDNTPAVTRTSLPGTSTGGNKSILAWDENGITYMIDTNTLSKDEVLKVAESLGK